jgi:hypothetical protein
MPAPRDDGLTGTSSGLGRLNLIRLQMLRCLAVMQVAQANIDRHPELIAVSPTVILILIWRFRTPLELVLDFSSSRA